MKDWLKNAFAVEGSAPPPLSAEQQVLVDRLCHEVVRRGLATPAIAFLEMSHPLNSVGAHTIHFFTPLLSALFDAESCRRLAEFLERRGSIELLCRRIEALQAEAQSSADGSPRAG